MLDAEIVVDASTDAAPNILARLAAKEPRLRVITAPQNLKLAGALNLGLDRVRAPLVARMDNDDIALPDGTPLRYDAAIPIAQDHDFVARLLLGGSRAVCLPDVLLRDCTHAAAASRSRFAAQGVLFRFCPGRAGPYRRVFRGRPRDARPRHRRSPRMATWLRRQTAQFVAWSLRRGGAGGMTLARAFARHGQDLMPAVVLRALDTTGWLPSGWHSAPDQAAV